MQLMQRIFAVGCIALTASIVAQTSPNPREIVLVPGTGSSADRAQAIQAAIQSLHLQGGGTLYLAAGTWLLSGGDKAIRVDGKKNVRIRGDGMATLLKQDPSTGISSNLFFLDNSESITFQDLAFEGPRLQNLGGDNQYSTAIQADAGTDLHVLRCTFTGFKTGAVVYQGGATRSEVSDCSFDRVDNRFSGDYGAIHLGGTSDILIRGNLFQELRFSGVSINSGGVRIRILENIMRFDTETPGVGTMGIYVTEGIQDCIFSGNQIYGPQYEGMDLRTKSSIGIPIRGNVLTENIMSSKFIGIALNAYHTGEIATSLGADHNIASGNVIMGRIAGNVQQNVEHGILSKWSRASLLSGNLISKCETGINFQDYPSENTLSGNLVHGAQGTAVFAPGSMIVTRNLIKTSGSGIGYAYTQNSEGSHTSITGNVFSGTEPRLSPGTNVSGPVIMDNCNENGSCN
jgi:hypothetical protein